jgi:hypothetical protein
MTMKASLITRYTGVFFIVIFIQLQTKSGFPEGALRTLGVNRSPLRRSGRQAAQAPLSPLDSVCLIWRVSEE